MCKKQASRKAHALDNVLGTKFGWTRLVQLQASAAAYKSKRDQIIFRNQCGGQPPQATLCIQGCWRHPRSDVQGFNIFAKAGSMMGALRFAGETLQVRCVRAKLRISSDKYMQVNWQRPLPLFKEFS